ncbi:hypothetical protein GCM10023196_100940 [Actinoallomurus vinaceus]|uniref:Secreted protein n=1 Tax=Actinoallomurus vinaceus TaxID=1080074 RepID=A0ABP8UU32_9ACTN
MRNTLISSTWAAACARPTMVSPSGSTVVAASLPSLESVRYASVESGRVRPGGMDLQAWHVLGMFPATQTNAQVKGAARKRAAVGPYPWRPPEQ